MDRPTYVVFAALEKSLIYTIDKICERVTRQRWMDLIKGTDVVWRVKGLAVWLVVISVAKYGVELFSLWWWFNYTSKMGMSQCGQIGDDSLCACWFWSSNILSIDWFLLDGGTCCTNDFL